MSTHPSGLNVRPADLSLSRPPRWAWTDRIVLGALNLILGNEGAGKGTLASWMIARLTRGELEGDLYGKPATVGVLGDEDGWNAVWTPRLHAVGADLTRVKLIEPPDGGYVELRDDHHRLACAVELEGITVLYLDALIDNLGVGVDDWRAKPVRNALQPLRSLAREFELAAIGSMHPNKSGGTFRQLVSGSVAFNAVSRSSLLLAEHPHDERRRVVVRGKGNLSRTPPAVEFDISSHKFTANGYTFDVPLAGNFGTSGLTVEDLINQPRPLQPAGEARTTARTLIAARLADGDWHHAGTIIQECGALDVHERAVRRASHDLGVDHEHRGFPAQVHWRLSESGHTPGRQSTDQPVRPVRTTNPAPMGRPDGEDSPDIDNAHQDRRPGYAQRAQATSRRAYDADTELARLAEKGLV
ncbi:MAG TPA: AAA family ATPase [Solirubrobacteraceae bacterium]|nr:AAA family ATPase [Solirubrobacteraceae bacterium]